MLKPPGRDKLQPWTFAGIMLSYWCNARCRFCYASCAPCENHWIAPADAVRWWRQLAGLARTFGKTVKIHLTGGEPFGNWPLLLEVATQAHAEGLTAGGSFQKVETNAFWATDAAIVRERLETLDRLGMGKFVISADPYHQQFVPPEAVRTCVETARQVLGPDRVQVRWQDWYERMVDLRSASGAEVEEAFRTACARHRERLTGRAACCLGPLLEPHPISRLGAEQCSGAILGARHVHIDPYGNVFPGTCAGIILGNANVASLEEIFEELEREYFRNPVVHALIQGGPHLLNRYARILGFAPRLAGYADKCHLCMDVRRFLFDRRVFEARLGPAQPYRLDSDDTTARAADD